MSEPQLKPCPFCGSLPRRDQHCPLVFCQNEQCQSTSIVDVWNTRPIEDSLRARIAELESKLSDVYASNLKLQDRIVLLGRRLGEAL